MQGTIYARAEIGSMATNPLKLRKWRINVFVQNDSVEITCIIQREVALLR